VLRPGPSALDAPAFLQKSISEKNILVVGGGGRVGGSVAKVLRANGGRVTIGGRSGYSGDDFDYLVIDKDEEESVSVLKDLSYDLVVNTAGPFQGKSTKVNILLGKCIDSRIPYIDVCDDFGTAKKAKSDFHQQAADANIPVILSTGCWPGVSSLMAKVLLNELGDDVDPAKVKCRFNFFTAGSGGAGVTLLVATFLILAEKALKVSNGVKMYEQPMEVYERVDFGENVGSKVRMAVRMNCKQNGSKVGEITQPFSFAGSVRCTSQFARNCICTRNAKNWLCRILLWYSPRLLEHTVGFQCQISEVTPLKRAFDAVALPFFHADRAYRR